MPAPRVGETLPVTLERHGPAAPSRSLTRLAVRPTRAGTGHAVSQIAATDAGLGGALGRAARAHHA